MSGSDEHGERDAPPPARGRWRRRVVFGLLGLMAVGALLLGVALWALANLDAPFFKRRIQAAAQASLGTSLDYRELSVSPFSGIGIRDLIIATPAELAAGGPELLRIDSIDIDANLLTALTGKLSISSVAIGPVAVTVVADETGRSSLDLLFPGRDPEEEPEGDAVPISHSLDALRDGDPFELGAFTLAPVSIEFVELDEGRVARRQTLDGLALSAAASLGVDAPTATLALTSADGGALATIVEGAGAGASERSARAEFDARLEIAGNQLTLRGAGRVLEQSFADQPPAPFDVYEIDLVATFEPEATRTRVRLAELSLLDGVGSATLDLDVYDLGDTGRIGRLSASGAGRVAFAELPVRLPGIELADVDARYDIDKLDLNAAGVAGALSASANVGRGAYALGGTRAEVTNLSASVDIGQSGAFGPSLTVSTASATLDLDSAAAELADGTAATADRVRFRYGGENIALPGGTEPERNRAELALAGATARADGSELALADAELVLTADGAVAALVNERPVSAILSGPIASVRARTDAGQRIELEAATVDVDLREFDLDGEGLLGLGGRLVGEIDAARVRGALPGQRINGAAVGARAEVDFDQRTASGTLPLGRLALSGPGGRTSLRKARLEWAVENPLALAPGQPGQARAQLRGTVAGLDASGRRATIPALRVNVHKRGARSYALEADSTVRDLSASGVDLPGRRTLKATADVDLSRDDVEVAIALRGPDGEAVDVGLDARFTAPRGELAYELDLTAQELGALLDAAGAADVGGVDSRAARVTLRATGALRGALVKPAGALAPFAATDPLANLRGQQKLSLEIAGVAYRDGDTELTLPAFTVAAASEHRDGGASTATLDADLSRVDARLGNDEIAVRGLRHQTTLAFADFPSADAVNVDTRTTVERVDHTYLDGYRVADVELAAALAATPSSVQVESFSFSNPAGRTRLDLSGALERWSDQADPRADGNGSADDAVAVIHGRNAVLLTGTLTQDMATFAESGFATRATGRLEVPFEVDSGDLVAYRARLALRPQAVTYVGPDESFVIENVTGYVPITQELLLTDDGVESFARAPSNVVARARFFDVQPFLDIEDYVTADRLTVAGETFGPIAGNLRVAGTSLSMDQLQVGYRGGTIAGKLLADYRPGDTTVLFRGNATGVKPSGSDEVLDANAALTFRPDTLALTGKVHLVRLAKEHLHEVLDALDPFHTDTAINRVRLGLRLGYPKFARLTVKEGLVNARIELGGAAGVVRLDEIHAIPVAPLLEKHLGPVVDALSRRPTGDDGARGSDAADDRVEQAPAIDEPMPGAGPSPRPDAPPPDVP